MPDPIVPAPSLPPNTRAVLPAHAQRGIFMPAIDGFINITLPGEIVRAKVEKILSRDVIVVRVISIVMNKSGHDVRTGHPLAVQRTAGELSEIWVPVDENETREREAVEKAERAAARAAPVEEPQPETPKKRGRRKAVE